MFNAIRLDENNEIDDVAIHGDLFRMERMNEKTFWVAIYRGQNRTAFYLTAEHNSLKVIKIEDSIGCIEEPK